MGKCARSHPSNTTTGGAAIIGKSVQTIAIAVVVAVAIEKAADCRSRGLACRYLRRYWDYSRWEAPGWSYQDRCRAGLMETIAEVDGREKLAWQRARDEDGLDICRQ